MESIKGQRILMRRLTIEDVFSMKNWGAHTDPLYFDYNFPKLSDVEAREWYKLKNQSKNKQCFGIFNEEDRIVGYIIIKHIKRFRKTSTLGIVFDPNYINKGYGTEAISTFLEYYFNELNMKSLYLDVAKFNQRAIKCYEKCGFVKIGESTKKLYLLVSDLKKSDYLSDNEYISIDLKKKKAYSHICKMKISRDMYTINSFF